MPYSHSKFGYPLSSTSFNNNIWGYISTVANGDIPTNQCAAVIQK